MKRNKKTYTKDSKTNPYIDSLGMFFFLNKLCQKHKKTSIIS